MRFKACFLGCGILDCNSSEFGSVAANIWVTYMEALLPPPLPAARAPGPHLCSDPLSFPDASR